MSDHADRDRDDGLIWGYMDDDTFRPLPKPPMLAAGLGPPPFSITMSDGRVRDIIHEPAIGEAMIDTKLLTRTGEYVTTVKVPPFQITAEVIQWGSRVFVKVDGEYLEGLMWVATDDPLVRGEASKEG